MEREGLRLRLNKLLHAVWPVLIVVALPWVVKKVIDERRAAKENGK